MEEEKWITWEIQTSKRWSDMEGVLRCTDIDFIDADHKILVLFAFKLNQVIDRLESEFSLALIEETKILLNNLYSYAQEHFSREEDFMDLYNLPETDMHKWEHKKILLMISGEISNFNSGKIKLSRRLKEQVMEWVIKHINEFDYNFFDITNWSQNIINATDWNQVKPIIRLTGINDIDNQHRKLTEITLNAMKKICMNPSNAIVEEECNNIINYAIFHFNYEVEFMHRYAIKEEAQHIDQHTYFIDKIKQYATDIEGDLQKVDEMKAWILTWWIEHINSVDKDYFAYRNWAYTLIEQAEELEDVLSVLRKTGVEEIDQEHEFVMGLTFQLNKMISGNNNNLYKKNMDSTENEVITIMDKVYQAAATHFEHEENRMKKNNMKDYGNHSSEHKELLKKISNLKENYISGRLYLSSNIKTMILEWWLEHTNTTDFRTFGQSDEE